MDACNFVPGHVILVHDDPSFIEEAAAALRTAGHDVATFIEPMEALNARNGRRISRSHQFG
jgi:DNA-binding NtrC family response regulator